MNHLELEQILNGFLKPKLIKDYCPNGLQIEGKKEIQKIITGVTACQALIDAAIENQADAILVHHGYFWRGEPEALRGMKYRRIKSLMMNDINLYAYHLPLDIHPEVGNNAQLAKLLGIEIKGGLEAGNPNSVAIWGELPEPVQLEDFKIHLEQVLHRPSIHIACENKSEIQSIGWCTGGGQDYINHAVAADLDVFISGEISERTTFIAREEGIHYFSAGHHATERYGVKALGEWLADTYGLDVEFIDIDNPV